MSILTIDSIVTEEKQFKVAKFDADVAFKLGIAAREYAQSTFPDKNVVIDITTVAGVNVFRTYLGEIYPDNEIWIKKKRNTVIRFERASKRYGLELESKGRTLQSTGLDPEQYTNYGGGFPIRLASAPDFVFAVITVSGLKDFEDHAVCVNALASLTVSLN